MTISAGDLASPSWSGRMTEHVPGVLPAGKPAAIDAAVAAMARGAIVGLPTETVYGLGVLPRPEPLAALIRAKGRARDKGIALLIDDLDQVADLVVMPDEARRLARRFWPGPLTLVLELRRTGSVPSELDGGLGTLGLRLADHHVPRSLARRLGPIAVTSANRSGLPPAQTADELLESVGPALSLVLDDGPVRGGVASTVVAVSAHGLVQVRRLGAIPEEVLVAVARGDAEADRYTDLRSAPRRAPNGPTEQP
jgi:L-threonylcarbamoyladenylate synthase